MRFNILKTTVLFNFRFKCIKNYIQKFDCLKIYVKKDYSYILNIFFIITIHNFSNDIKIYEFKNMVLTYKFQKSEF